MTMLGLALLSPAKGMTRVGGASLILSFRLFIVAYVLWPTLSTFRA